MVLCMLFIMAFFSVASLAMATFFMTTYRIGVTFVQMTFEFLIKALNIQI
jgi:hypothetical protein